MFRHVHCIFYIGYITYSLYKKQYMGSIYYRVGHPPVPFVNLRQSVDICICPFTETIRFRTPQPLLYEG